MRIVKVVLCSDPSDSRLGQLADRLRSEGFTVLEAPSAAACLSLADQYRPAAIILDKDLLQIDQESIPDYLRRISPESVILISVEEGDLPCPRPLFVRAHVPRGDFAAVIAMLNSMLFPRDPTR